MTTSTQPYFDDVNVTEPTQPRRGFDDLRFRRRLISLAKISLSWGQHSMISLSLTFLLRLLEGY